jgi:hypothetical protein
MGMRFHPCITVIGALAAGLLGTEAATGPMRRSSKNSPAEWFERLLAFPYTNATPSEPGLQLVRQDFEQLERNRSVIGTPLTIGSRGFVHGLGTHSISHLRVLSPKPIDRFEAWVGVDANERTRNEGGSVVFSVEADGCQLFRSPVRRGGEEPVQVAVSNSPASEVRALDLLVEMRYIEGLYAYWDRLAATWPDSLREECASGGRRIDLETLQRMPLHQKSDYWFDNEVDQASLWSLSQYLPNNLITVPLTRLDDYSFRSTLAASVIPAWIADAPGFDRERAKQLLDRYRAIRQLLVGAWYPLLPYTRSPRDWMAMQFHRPDLGGGMILVFRHAESPYRTVEVALRGLWSEQNYTLSFDSSGEKRRARGADLMRGLLLSLGARPGSELITYSEIQD